MSLATWKAEFYPFTAEKCAAEFPEEALDHSIRKWEGLSPENLKKHGVLLSPRKAPLQGWRSFVVDDEMKPGEGLAVDSG